MLLMVLHTNLKQQNVLRIDRASDSVFMWHGSISLKKGMACAGVQHTVMDGHPQHQ